MKALPAALAFAGLLLATILIARSGAAGVVAAMKVAGAGVLWASAFHVVPMTLNARAWQALLGRRVRSLLFLTWLIWVREAINNLLPVARVGGEVADARILIRRGVRGTAAVGSLAVSVAVTLLTQIVFTLVGLLLLLGRKADPQLTRAALLGAAFAAVLFVLVAWLQQGGLFDRLRGLVQTVAGQRFARLIGDVRGLDRAVRALWTRRLRIARCAVWQLAGWIVAAGEVWIFVRWSGRPMALSDAVLIESLVQACSSAAFLVPGALGVQEGAFLAAGNLVGLPPSTSLALALSRRARDVLLFVPALLIWQAGEARFTLRTARDRVMIRSNRR